MLLAFFLAFRICLETVLFQHGLKNLLKGKCMKLLLLGGTVFLGRHIVEESLTRGHEVTLFNRGQHNPDLFPHVEKLPGDLHGDVTALQGRHWYAVIDISGYVTRVVRSSAEALAHAVAHYTFI